MSLYRLLIVMPLKGFTEQHMEYMEEWKQFAPLNTNSNPIPNPNPSARHQIVPR
jgi:hypothetical protein